MKKEQGITLVSLVVTIIVLIILAGVSINLLLGQNGIITIAKQSKENMQLAQVEEQEDLNELYSQISEEGGNSTSYDSIAKLVEFKREIASAITDVGITTPEDASAETMASNIRSISFSSGRNYSELITIRVPFKGWNDYTFPQKPKVIFATFYGSLLYITKDETEKVYKNGACEFKIKKISDNVYSFYQSFISDNDAGVIYEY